VPERLAGDGHAQLGGGREVRLRGLAGAVALAEHHLLVRAVRRAPRLHATLQRSQLAIGVPLGVRLAQHLKQRLRLKLRRRLEPRLDIWPVLDERIRPRPPVAGHLHLRWQLAGGHVLARRLAVHGRLHGGPAELAVFGQFLHQLPYLRVADRSHPPIVTRTIGVATFLSGGAGPMGRRSCRRWGNVIVAQQVPLRQD
jgi:hypothetical protein